MNRIYHIIVLFLLISCSTSKEESLESNQTINSIFNEAEIQDLNMILLFFNEQICTNEKVNSTELMDCYLSFFEKIFKAMDSGEDVEITSFDKQLNLYKEINKATFDEIWNFGKSWKPNSPDTLKYLAFNCGGKYARFLKKLGNENPFVKKYYDSYEATCDLTPSMITSLGMEYKKYDIKDIRIRLFVAIHYLTMSDHFEREEKI